MKIKKKGYSTYEKGGAIDPPKDRSKDIEALKAKYRETKDPNVKKDLDSAREEQKLYDSGQFMDDMREGRAQKAETKGDEGRAKRIRSSKQTQGRGETGRDEEGKKFSKGGKVDGKGMTTAERKNQYMDSVKEKQEKEKAETRKKNSSKLATSYGSTRVISPSPEETSKFVSGALDNIEAKREEKKYKPAREAASKRFDEATKYDELLGRSTNPDKYSKGGKMMPKAGYGMRIKKKK